MPFGFDGSGYAIFSHNNNNNNNSLQCLSALMGVVTIYLIVTLISALESPMPFGFDGSGYNK